MKLYCFVARRLAEAAGSSFDYISKHPRLVCISERDDSAPILPYFVPEKYVQKSLESHVRGLLVVLPSLLRMTVHCMSLPAFVAEVNCSAWVAADAIAGFQNAIVRTDEHT